MINIDQYTQVTRYLERSGAPEQLEQLLRPGPAGRPRTLTVQVFMTFAVLNAQQGRPMHQSKIHDLMVHGSSIATQEAAFGSRKTWPRIDGRKQPLTLRQVRYLFNAITRTLQASLNYYQPADGEDPLTGAYRRQARKDCLADITNRVVESASLHLPSATSVAVDQTAIPSAARQALNAQRLRDIAAEIDAAAAEGRPANIRQYGDRSYDKDAMFGHRTVTATAETDRFFGYKADIAVRLPSDRTGRNPSWSSGSTCPQPTATASKPPPPG